MKKSCEWCKCEFETYKRSKRYCSHACAMMAVRKRTFEQHEAKAQEMGITLDELEKLIRGRKLKLTDRKKRTRDTYKYTHRPKTYAEIRAYNAAHPLKLGWRR